MNKHSLTRVKLKIRAFHLALQNENNDVSTDRSFPKVLARSDRKKSNVTKLEWWYVPAPQTLSVYRGSLCNSKVNEFITKEIIEFGRPADLRRTES